MSSKRAILVASSVALALTTAAVSAFGNSDPSSDPSSAEPCAAVTVVAEQPSPEPVLEEPVLEEEGELLAAVNWTHSGCIYLNGKCYDVFNDGSGNLWVCKECYTTRNPNPNKCRRLTPWEIANSPWCS